MASSAVPPRTRCGLFVVAVTVAAYVTVTITAGTRPALAAPVSYRPPVDAPVVDPFRPPPTPYGAGNRGIEYATVAGTPARAAADGQVVFAGLVAGTQHVTLLHADGIRTTYAFLGGVDVHAGDRVVQGDRVGATASRFHFSARVGDVYIDPALLFAAAPLHVYLVPDGPPPEPWPGQAGQAGERAALEALIADFDDGGVGVVGAAVDWARTAIDRAAPPYAELLHYLREGRPDRHVLRVLDAAVQWWARRSRCTPPGELAGRPGAGHLAVLVGGLGSSSADAAIDRVDTNALGYAAPDVVRFSYAGGLIPDPTDRRTGLAVAAYESADTQGDLRVAGERLADVLEAFVAAAPGVPVDVLAHSQGGLVTRLALRVLTNRSTARARATLAALGAVVTLGTPHEGADLATAVAAARRAWAGASVLDAAGSALGLHPGAVAVGQLAETSFLLDELRGVLPPPGAVVVSIAARGDLVVPAGRSRWRGATSVVVEGAGLFAHDELPGSVAAQREIALAVGHRPPTCETALDAIADAVVSDAIGWTEDAIGAAAGAGGVALPAPAG